MVTDYFSNYPEVGQLQSTSSKAVISYLKTVFRRHGVPCELFTDNGPQFSSGEFASFANEWGIQHSVSSPTYPKSNGLAESSVKTVKGLMKKNEDRDDFQKSLLIYRSTPLQNGLSPAQMLMGRRIRSNLPISEDLLTPKGAHKIRKEKVKQREEQKRLHDRTAKRLPTLKHGDRVRLRDINSGAWRLMARVEKVAPRSYRVQTECGLSLRRNRTDLKLQQTDEETTAQEREIPQHTPESPVPVSSEQDHADSGLTVVSSSTAAEKLSRPRREIKPTQRLIENC